MSLWNFVFRSLLKVGFSSCLSGVLVSILFFEHRVLNRRSVSSDSKVASKSLTSEFYNDFDIRKITESVRTFSVRDSTVSSASGV